jgi:hypothetical protein
LEEEMNAQMEKDKRVIEGMKSQIGITRKKESKSSFEDEYQVKGIMSRSYYLDVIFVQIVLLLLLYGVCVLVVPKLV